MLFWRSAVTLHQELDGIYSINGGETRVFRSPISLADVELNQDNL
jgi:hypothetical protein